MQFPRADIPESDTQMEQAALELAQGVVRHLQREFSKPVDSAQNSLDVCAKMSLHGGAVNAQRQRVPQEQTS